MLNTSKFPNKVTKKEIFDISDHEFGTKILRPQSLDDYIGQKNIKQQLKVFLEAAKQRNEPIEHVLFYGPPGLGKTTLANIMAKEMKVEIKITSGPAIERIGDLGSILTNLNDGDVLFIDEIHRLNKSIEEVLYPVMEDYKLDLVVGKGPGAQALQIDLPKFTLIGATTKLGFISNPMRDRFGVIHRLEFYSHDEIVQIIKRSSNILNVKINSDALNVLANASRRTPRIANRLLKRSRDYAQVQKYDIITKEVVELTLKNLGIDKSGLEPADRELLRFIIEKFNGGPVGVSTLANVLSEDIRTIQEAYEPYLLQLGLLEKTPRGRITTKKAYEILGYKYLNSK